MQTKFRKLHETLSFIHETLSFIVVALSLFVATFLFKYLRIGFAGAFLVKESSSENDTLAVIASILLVERCKERAVPPLLKAAFASDPDRSIVYLLASIEGPEALAALQEISRSGPYELALEARATQNYCS